MTSVNPWLAAPRWATASQGLLGSSITADIWAKGRARWRKSLMKAACLGVVLSSRVGWTRACSDRGWRDCGRWTTCLCSPQSTVTTSLYLTLLPVTCRSKGRKAFKNRETGHIGAAGGELATLLSPHSPTGAIQISGPLALGAPSVSCQAHVTMNDDSRMSRLLSSRSGRMWGRS